MPTAQQQVLQNFGTRIPNQIGLKFDTIASIGTPICFDIRFIDFLKLSLEEPGAVSTFLVINV